MDEAKKKQLQQILILVVLLVVLGVAMSMMLGRQTATSPGSATEAAASKPSTAMASAGITDADRQRMGGTTSVPAAASNIQRLNPNMWKVYTLTPPKNPFVQQESWYADTFRKLLPGYPQLKSNGFFDKPTEVLPDLNALFGAGIDFEYVDINRDFPERNYTLQGTSEDGKMNTVLSAVEKRPENTRLTFDPGGNLIDKDSIRQATLTNRMADGGAATDTTSVNGINFGGLPPLPGLDGVAGQQRGNAMSVHGVSIHSGRSSALVMLNGVTRIVKVGDDLTAQYAVSKITGSGIEIRDTKSGETKFIELRAPSTAASDAPSGMMRGMNL
jgi:hypothetical protein